MEALAPIDSWVVAAILAKACGYATALLAIGGPLFVIAFREAPQDVLRVARTLAVGAAVLGLAVLALRFGIRAARISGMGAAGMTDTMMLGIVWQSPLGEVALVRATGALLVLALVFDGLFARVCSVVGAILLAASYALIGHSLGDPRWLLAGFLTVHLLAAGFWVAAFVPLYRAANGSQGAAVLHRFGRVASLTVPLLIFVGAVFAWIMVGSLSGLVRTSYGWVLLFKLLSVAGLLSLAALNKFRLVPAFAAEHDGASADLKRSIRWEVAAIAIILITTATLTTLTTPPVNL